MRSISKYLHRTVHKIIIWKSFGGTVTNKVLNFNVLWLLAFCCNQKLFRKLWCNHWQIKVVNYVLLVLSNKILLVITNQTIIIMRLKIQVREINVSLIIMVSKWFTIHYFEHNNLHIISTLLLYPPDIDSLMHVEYFCRYQGASVSGEVIDYECHSYLRKLSLRKIIKN